MKKIFISRAQSADSVFSKELTRAGYEVHGESLLSFYPIPFTSVPVTDWLFFYSQRGVHFFFEQYAKIGDITSFPYKCAVFGPATADAIRQFNVTPYFTGTGNAVSDSKYFYEVIAGEPVCFVQAKNSQQSVQRIMEDQIEVLNLVVYDNDIREDFSLPYFDILVFTSPMNAQAYFEKYDLKEDQVVIAIGHTTKSALLELGVKCLVSEFPSELALAKVCLEV